MTERDPVYTLFLQEHNNGRGIRTFTGAIIEAIARELEVLLNSKDEESRAALSRRHAYIGRGEENYTYPNFVRHCIDFLARYGIFIRQMQENDLINRILDELIKCQLESTRAPKPIGVAHRKKKDKGALLGEGNVGLCKFALGGEHYRALATSFAEFKRKNKDNKLTYSDLVLMSKTHTSQSALLQMIW